MKLTIGILATAITMTAGAAWAQNPDAIDNARSVAKSLQQKQANDTNAALDAAGVSAKPAPGAPAPAVKPAVLPGSTPAPAAPAPTAKATSASGAQNQLRRVNIVQGADGVRVEIIANHAVAGKVSKLDSPARVLVELPETVSASPQNHISFASAGVKGVRIGTDGKTPPTTSVVVDLEKACAYELTPGPGDKLVLTLHTDAAAAVSGPATAPATKSTPTTAKATASPAKAPVVAKATPAPAPAPAKSAAPAAKTQTAAAKPAAPAKEQGKTVVSVAKPAPAPAPAAEPAKSAEAAKPKAEDKKWAMSGKRDPFFSPVVQQNGSGCSTGKKCLEIGNINLRGVVKSDSGFIAVVTNNLNKAYFLRENDPVFNGYVVKITGDSVVFQETVQDKLGKPFTREVVKRIFTPAV